VQHSQQAAAATTALASNPQLGAMLLNQLLQLNQSLNPAQAAKQQPAKGAGGAAQQLEAAVGQGSMQQAPSSAAVPSYAGSWRPQVRPRAAAAPSGLRVPPLPERRSERCCHSCIACHPQARSAPTTAACPRTPPRPQVYTPALAMLSGGLPGAAPQDTSLASGGTNGTGSNGGTRSGRGERDSRQLALDKYRNKRKVGAGAGSRACRVWARGWARNPGGGAPLLACAGRRARRARWREGRRGPRARRAAAACACPPQCLPLITTVPAFLRRLQNLKFGKTIRYESRKALAQQRPRVKGQFVKHSQQGSSQVGLQRGALPLRSQPCRRCMARRHAAQLRRYCRVRTYCRVPWTGGAPSSTRQQKPQRALPICTPVGVLTPLLRPGPTAGRAGGR
jgi:hypothetical protein